MKILVCEPGKHPYVKEIEHTLENLQKEVGGYIQALYPFEEEVAVVCNEEGLFIEDLQWNRTVEKYGPIKGTFFVCGLGFSNGLSFTIGGTTVTLTALAIAAIAGILLNMILPGNDYEFGVNESGDENRGIHA